MNVKDLVIVLSEYMIFQRLQEIGKSFFFT